MTAAMVVPALITDTPQDILALAAEAVVCTIHLTVVITVLGASEAMAQATVATTIAGLAGQQVPEAAEAAAHALRRHPLLRAVTAEADFL